MRKVNKYLLVTFLIIFSILLTSLAGCSIDINMKNLDDLNEKGKTEIEYISKELISIVNRLNNIDFTNYMVSSKEIATSANENIIVTEVVEKPISNTDYNNIDWNTVKESIELFIGSWNTIILDLYKLNISGSDITEFSHYLDELLISIKNENKVSALTNSIYLYSYIPKYLEAIDTKSIAKVVFNTKLHILTAYANASTSNWEHVNAELKIAEDTFNEVMNNLELLKTKEYSINKTYIALKELQNSSKSQDFIIFLIKYKNIMEEIENLTQLDKNLNKV